MLWAADCLDIKDKEGARKMWKSRIKECEKEKERRWANETLLMGTQRVANIISRISGPQGSVERRLGQGKDPERESWASS